MLAHRLPALYLETLRLLAELDRAGHHGEALEFWIWARRLYAEAWTDDQERRLRAVRDRALRCMARTRPQ